MPDTKSFAERFRTGLLLTLRPAAGPGGKCLLVQEAEDDSRGRVWDVRAGEVGEPLPFAVDMSSVLTPDGEWVVLLDDDGGSEVGTLVAKRTDSGAVRQLTSGRGPFVVRGLDIDADGSQLLATIVDESGHHLLLIPLADPARARDLHTAQTETWFGHISADGRYVCADTTSHCPSVRRPAVTVLDAATGEVVGVANDLPQGPLRAVRFSPEPGDARILLSTERSGFARPAIWNPVAGIRQDYDLPELSGETLVLDWHPGTGQILVVENRDGVQRLFVVDEESGEPRVVCERAGSYAMPDVASTFPYYWQSSFGPDGTVLIMHSSWTEPLQVLRETPSGIEPAIPSPEMPRGRSLESVLVDSADGTRVQLWWAAPEQAARGTILDIHGGPNLVSVNEYRPSLQRWLDEGFAVASLNYRGSVGYGRAFREGFWGVAGDREIEDIQSAVQWLRTQGLADPSSTFITGPSYGGHLTLLSLGRLPDLFAGGFAVVAMADWEAAWPDMNASLRTTWRSFMSVDQDGTIDESRIMKALRRFSAINYVDAVRGSVWLYQGGRDTRTPPEQAKRYDEELRAAGGDVLLEWFDAGHEPTGVRGAQVEFERELELANARLAGRKWS